MRWSRTNLQRNDDEGEDDEAVEAVRSLRSDGLMKYVRDGARVHWHLSTCLLMQRWLNVRFFSTKRICVVFFLSFRYARC